MSISLIILYLLFSSLFSLIFLFWCLYFIIVTKWNSREFVPPQTLISNLSIKIFFKKNSKNQFNKNFIKHPLITLHYIDESFFQKYEFFETFNQVGLRRFIYNKPKKMFSKLVKMFYVNLQRQDGIIIFELHKINFFSHHWEIWNYL